MPAAIGWGYGNAGTSGHCTASSAATGLFGAEPSVVITFEKIILKALVTYFLFLKL